MEEYRLERHYKLWEQNNTLIKRVVFLSLVLAIALLVKVLVPFVAHSEEKSPALQRIEQLRQQESHASSELGTIKRTEAVLQEVNRFIASQPWQREKQELIRRFRDMRNASDPESYQREADDTVGTIADMLQANVVVPLREGAGIGGTQGRALPRAGVPPARGEQPQALNREIESLHRFIEGWQAEYTGKRWYGTIGGKEDTMSDLSRDLNQRLTSFSRVVRQELGKVEQDREAVQAELKTLDSQIGEEADRLEEIEKELESILPQWLRGLVETYQVIQLLPVLLVAAATYVLVIGINLTRHFRRYIVGKQFAETLSGDPAMSSTWTLIPRGRLGTALTTAAYTLFFLSSWWLFEWSLDLLQTWLAIDSSQAWIGAHAVWDGFRWFGRAVFAALVASAWVLPWRASVQR